MSNSDDIRKLYFDKIDSEEESLIQLDESTNLKYEKLELLYNELIPKNIYEDAKMQSLDERTKLGVENDDNFVYGEMTFRTLSYIYETIKKIYGPNSIKEGNFYDLGSGHGHVCVQASLIHPFKKCVGIELISSLNKMAQDNLNVYNCKMQLIMENNQILFTNHKRKVPEIEYIEGSFFDREWPNPSMVFSNSTCFSKDIMDQIFERANNLPKGTFFVNTSQRMSKKTLENWHYLTPFQRVMSWGVARIFIYRKK